MYNMCNKFQEIKRQKSVSFNHFIVVQFIIEIWMYTIQYINNEISTTACNNNTCLDMIHLILHNMEVVWIVFCKVLLW